MGLVKFQGLCVEKPHCTLFVFEYIRQEFIWNVTPRSSVGERMVNSVVQHSLVVTKS